MYCCVVVAAYTKGALGKHLAVGKVGSGTLLVEDVEQYRIFGFARNDNNVLEVLGSGTDERDATYINLLDDVGLACTACHGLLEWIEVYYNKVDLGDGILSHLLYVALVVAACKDAAEDTWMKCLDTTAKN